MISLEHLEEMNISELRDLEKDVKRAIATYTARQIATAKADVEAYAAKLGFKLNDLVGASASKKAPINQPKYRNPAEPTQTWSGIGRQPKWVKQLLADGKSLDDFVI